MTSMDGTLNTAMQATGNIKVFQITVSIIMCLDIPLAYFLLSLGVEPYLVTGVSIFTAILCLFVKLIILRRQVPYNLSEFIGSIVCKNIVVFIIVILIFSTLSSIIPKSTMGFCMLGVLSFVINVVIIYLIGLNISERKMFVSMISYTIKRIKNEI